jgi:phosphate transport system protein
VSTAQHPHTSRDFDEQLSEARRLVRLMGERVTLQLAGALTCFESGRAALIDHVMREEALVNRLERAIDELIGQILARRQPAAVDLRLLLALAKITTDLERVGDEAKNIALQARKIFSADRLTGPGHAEVRRMGRIVLDMLRQALALLEAMEIERTPELLRRDFEVDDLYGGILRQLITFMIGDPRTISPCLDVVFVARSLERIGDHAKNISEYVIYAVKGRDVRHISIEDVEREVRG